MALPSHRLQLGNNRTSSVSSATAPMTFRVSMWGDGLCLVLRSESRQTADDQEKLIGLLNELLSQTGNIHRTST